MRLKQRGRVPEAHPDQKGKAGKVLQINNWLFLTMNIVEENLILQHLTLETGKVKFIKPGIRAGLAMNISIHNVSI